MLHYNVPGCRILEGSALSLHDDRYFVLQVQKGERIETRWNLPDEMRATLGELVELTNDPEEQARKPCPYKMCSDGMLTPSGSQS